MKGWNGAIVGILTFAVDVEEGHGRVKVALEKESERRI
jgi:hypothetical protein